MNKPCKYVKLHDTYYPVRLYLTDHDVHPQARTQFAIATHLPGADCVDDKRTYQPGSWEAMYLSKPLPSKIWVVVLNDVTGIDTEVQMRGETWDVFLKEMEGVLLG